MTTVNCGRCARTDAPALARAPMAGVLGKQIHANVCADCWAEWVTAEVMVINELKLNLMDPTGHATLMTHLREFLQLEPAG